MNSEGFRKGSTASSGSPRTSRPQTPPQHCRPVPRRGRNENQPRNVKDGQPKYLPILTIVKQLVSTAGDAKEAHFADQLDFQASLAGINVGCRQKEKNNRPRLLNLKLCQKYSNQNCDPFATPWENLEQKITGLAPPTSHWFS